MSKGGGGNDPSLGWAEWAGNALGNLIWNSTKSGTTPEQPKKEEPKVRVVTSGQEGHFLEFKKAEEKLFEKYKQYNEEVKPSTLGDLVYNTGLGGMDRVFKQRKNWDEAMKMYNSMREVYDAKAPKVLGAANRTGEPAKWHSSPDLPGAVSLAGLLERQSVDPDGALRDFEMLRVELSTSLATLGVAMRVEEEYVDAKDVLPY